ncbi:beta-N-acetylhexosaminidase [Thiomicrospira microaerophila]|uniref:beta-N-acetylhexosaminidase n=1 Tax=Thiomicrospira microaerophila TaxID=406020 RepID=UPI00200EB785|nr:beta-N-acetylhexosaminidase [Thiomicrospira microaerophila]UQB41393.1 beta-N-acetylhexosaminidase [Thiomicrospira microaerophila]
MIQTQGKAMSLGSVMIGIAGTSLLPHEREYLLHPRVAGVILFSRNYASPEQLRSLCEQIHNLRHPRLLIAVDHEGGRVQRFREGFSRIPPMRLLGEAYQQDQAYGLNLAKKIGWLMATELLACGVDFSFAPVVDLDYGESHVIGDRAFSPDPLVTGQLAMALTQGMRDAGMASVAKHFPGHGFVSADTHETLAIDPRSGSQIEQRDMQPFIKLMAHGLEAVMPAHVRYPAVDDLPVGFSKVWLQKVLRQTCHFEGAIISDDLGMQAAAVYGDTVERVRLAIDAGCDLVLVCNELAEISRVLNAGVHRPCVVSHARLIRLHGKPIIRYDKLRYNPLWQSAVKQLAVFNERNQSNLL